MMGLSVGSPSVQHAIDESSNCNYRHFCLNCAAAGQNRNCNYSRLGSHENDDPGDIFTVFENTANVSLLNERNKLGFRENSRVKTMKMIFCM